ncbi:uncharacterized protein QC761_0024390 [Podospora bellae-mahoneyi]|uniref:Uncharacterized protein n=1 Tax=Podospora bellae-mahoneyi TaxID=2093777 RepID=A0ABR0G1Z4_9PEZI|nr:hypothetical protein QC761_0024390 [Podospora bellae-mahoneyi]
MSYFLECALQDLAKHRTRIPYRSLHQHLRNLVRKYSPKQTPMFYGMLQEPFFKELQNDGGLLPVTIHHDQVNGVTILTLEAGKAHGVAIGDEYEAVPFYAPETGEAVKEFSDQAITLRVVEVYTLTSSVCHQDESVVTSRFSAKTVTWKARLVRSCCSNEGLVRLPQDMEEAELSRLAKEVEDSPYVKLLSWDDRSSPIAFSVTIDGTTNSYVVHDATGSPVTRAPMIRRGDCDAIKSLARVLGHLAKFMLFKNLRHEEADEGFKDSVSFEVIGHTCGEDGWYTVKHEDDWKLQIRNMSKETLYIGIFNFGFWWEIDNLLSGQGEGEFLTLQSVGHALESTESLGLEWKLDEEDGDEREDVVRLFITDKPTSFQGMELSSLKADIGRGDESDSLVPQNVIGGRFAVRTFKVKTRRYR